MIKTRQRDNYAQYYVSASQKKIFILLFRNSSKHNVYVFVFRKSKSKVLSMMKVVLPEIMFILPAFDLKFFEGYTGSLCAS